MENKKDKLKDTLKKFENAKIQRMLFENAKIQRMLADVLRPLVESLVKSVQALQSDLKKSTESQVREALQKLSSSTQDLQTARSLISDEVGTVREELKKATEDIKGLIPKTPEPFDARYLEDQLRYLDKCLAGTAKHKDVMELLSSLSEEVKKLREELKDVKQRSGGTSGGVTNMRITQAFKYILKTEQPVGAIDGVNTTYNVSQPIFSVLSFAINKAVISEIPNYTINGDRIVFTSPLPAAYAGKDFEIKYV